MLGAPVGRVEVPMILNGVVGLVWIISPLALFHLGTAGGAGPKGDVGKG